LQRWFAMNFSLRDRNHDGGDLVAVKMLQSMSRQRNVPKRSPPEL
jgi:hypothetical protein